MTEKIREVELSTSGIMFHATSKEYEQFIDSVVAKDIEAWLLLHIVERRTDLETITDHDTATLMQGMIAAYRNLLNLPQTLLEEQKMKEQKGERNEPE